MGRVRVGLRAAALMAAWVLAGCFGSDPDKDPVESLPVEGTWIQTRVEFHTNTAKKGLVPLPLTYTIVNGDTIRSHVIYLDTAVGSLFDPFHEALIRIDETKIVRQGVFGFWLIKWNWDDEADFIKRDSTSFVKMSGSRRLFNGTDTVLCMRSGTELKLQFQGLAGLADSIVITAYYKLYTGVFPVPEPSITLSAGLGTLDSLIQQMQGDTALLHDLTSLLDSLLAPPGPDSSSGPDTLATGTTAFYQFGDKKDNDGDGCLDEEIIDSLDNDLDGFVDEDARVTVADGVDNDHKNGVDEAAENVAGTLLSPQAPYLLTFVALSGQGENWVKIKKDAANMEIRLRIQKDSLFLPSRASQPGYAAKLDSAKTLVGGCWRNY